MKSDRRASAARSQLRKASSRMLAFYWETALGNQWTSLREVVPQIADILGVECDSGQGRSDIQIACMQRLVSQGVAVPGNYTQPWYRP